MKAIAIALVSIFLLFGCSLDEPIPYENQPKDHDAWCKGIDHRNVSCPEFDARWNTPAQQEKEFIDWCDRIYHRNVSCPLHGKTLIPKDVVEKEAKDFAKWCDSIGHVNVGCPKFDPRDDL